jgi:hypothetical protein
MDVPATTRFLLAAEVEESLTRYFVVLDWESTHVLAYFSSSDRAQVFADPDSGGVPQRPGVTWHSVELSPGEILYLLERSMVDIDAVIPDPLPVPGDYPLAPLHIFVSRLKLESKQTVQPIEGYDFFVC